MQPNWRGNENHNFEFQDNKSCYNQNSQIKNQPIRQINQLKNKKTVIQKLSEDYLNKKIMKYNPNRQEKIKQNQVIDTNYFNRFY